MGSAIGEILPIAIGVAISPIPIIAVVLLLTAPKGSGKALGFVLGWVIGLGVVGVIALLVADPAGATTDGGPATWVGWLLVVLGAMSILLGIRQFRGRPRGDKEPPMPKWMASIDGSTTGRSAATGFIVAALNPKTLTLTLAAGATIAAAGLPTSDSFLVLALFVVIGTVGLAIPVGIYFLGGDGAATTLNELRRWLAVNNTAIMAVLFVVIGAKLLGNGLEIVLA